jgi:hypothetical protein
VPDEALTSFLQHCSKKIGDDYFRTPRNTIRAFLDLLAILEQNPGADWSTLLGTVEVVPEPPVLQADIEDKAFVSDSQREPTAAADGEESLASFSL